MWPTRPELIPVSVAWSDWEYFYCPLDGMLVHCRVTPSIKFNGTHLFTWVERGTVRVKCLSQEHNTMSPASARTRTAHCCSRKYPYPSHGRFFKLNPPHPSVNSILVSYFCSKNWAFEIPRPLGISVLNLPWGGHGYFLELHNHDLLAFVFKCFASATCYCVLFDWLEWFLWVWFYVGHSLLDS